MSEKVETTPCQRCIEGRPALYRVFTDEINMRVCEQCAQEARRMGLGVESI